MYQYSSPLGFNLNKILYQHGYQRVAIILLVFLGIMVFFIKRLNYYWYKQVWSNILCLNKFAKTFFKYQVLLKVNNILFGLLQQEVVFWYKMWIKIDNQAKSPVVLYPWSVAPLKLFDVADVCIELTWCVFTHSPGSYTYTVTPHTLLLFLITISYIYKTHFVY